MFKRRFSRRLRVILGAIFPTLFVLLLTEFMSARYDWNWWVVLIILIGIVLLIDLLIIVIVYYRHQSKK